LANKTVTDASATNTQMDNATRNPNVVATAGTGSENKKIVHITLEVRGVTLDPDNIYDMLDSQFAVVQSPKSSLARNCWIFEIGPA
jgi:hypothetical protein